MQEVLWLAAGSLVTGTAFLVCRRRMAPIPRPARRGGSGRAAGPVARPVTAALPASRPVTAPEPQPAARPAAQSTAVDQPRFASAVAVQLASIASGIEGSAQLLIEAAARPDLLPAAAERLWTAVHRLNRLHVKLRAYAAPPLRDLGPTELPGLLTGLREDLQHQHLGLQVALHLPPSLPLLRAGRPAVQDALLCLCTALLHMEHGALRLSISAQAQYDAAEPEVAIELELEWLEEPERERAANACHEHELECAAARNLIQSQGGTLELQHNQEQCVARALVSLPAAPVSTRPADARPRARTPVRTGGRQRGNYGGVLVLEQDPAIRSLLAAELKSRGRNVFACSDAASARTLLRATPERFELMIVDQRAQAEPGHRLAESAARLCPDLHVCVLATDDATAEPPADLRERLHRLGKPFGMPELRSLLEDLLPR